MKAPAPLGVRLRRSWLFILAAAAIYGATAALVAILPLAPSYRAGMLALIVVHFLWVSWRHGLRKGRKAITSLVVHADRSAEFQNQSGTINRYRIADSTVVRSNLALIHAYPAEGRAWPWRLATILILPDMLDSETFRRLRVLLRTSRETSKQLSS